MIDLERLLHVQGATLWLPCTMLLFAGSSALYRRLNKAPIANPTLLTIAAVAVILVSGGVPYKTYFEGVAVLHYLLGTAGAPRRLPPSCPAPPPPGRRSTHGLGPCGQSLLRTSGGF